ncbi:MAG TPA: aminotransferase class I/II-fold pyridoxal phosphate-dependent enzyme, partial [Planctomycetaceae bacterium]|nr:aminotransferase class I/II-fold pyridoxal phosphate-dependent enzyme [Planctomycetaceae bacterium]
SGMRAGYLCGSPRLIGEVRRHTPPWEVSLPAQIAVVRTLGERDYYCARWKETAVLRERLADSLMRLGLKVVEGTANFLLVHLTGVNTDAQQIIEACRSRGLYLRDLSSLDSNLGRTAFRIAVKSAEFNERMISVLEESLRRVSISAPGRETDRLPVTTG